MTQTADILREGEIPEDIKRATWECLAGVKVFPPTDIGTLSVAIALAILAERQRINGVADEPERLWLSSETSDGHRDVWFDPDEGGTLYIRADLICARNKDAGRLHNWGSGYNCLDCGTSFASMSRVDPCPGHLQPSAPKGGEA